MDADPRAVPGVVGHGPHRGEDASRARPRGPRDLPRSARDEDRRSAGGRRGLARRDRLDERGRGRVRAHGCVVPGRHPRRGGRRDADRVLLPDRPWSGRARLGGGRRRGRGTRREDARRREADDRSRAGRARSVRRDVLPGRAGGRALRGCRAEGPVPVRRPRRGAGRLGALHARGRRDERRGPRRGSVRRRGCAERPDGAVHEGCADRVPPQRLHGAQGRNDARPGTASAATARRRGSARRTSTSTRGRPLATSCCGAPRAAC